MEERCSAFLALNRISKISVDMYTFIYKASVILNNVILYFRVVMLPMSLFLGM